MSLNIRDRVKLSAAVARIEELILTCRARGPTYCIDPVLTADVTRKAKGLHTSLATLVAAVDEPNHQPLKEETMRTEPLAVRIHFQQHLADLASYINYGGRREKDVKEKCDELCSEFGDAKVMWALHELTMRDEKTGLTVLRPEARKAAYQLLGPAPESPEYESYWSANKRAPPEEHHPPAPEEQGKPVPRRGRKR